MLTVSTEAIEEKSIPLVDGSIDITSVMTLDTLANLGVKKGDSVRVLIKAVSVLLVRE